MRNREKAVIVDALNEKYSLPVFLSRLKMAQSSYNDQKQRISFTSKHEADFKAIAAIFQENKQRYGYGRIKAILNRQEYTPSEKVIRKIMRENWLIAITRKAKKYSSYKGEISPAVPDIIQRNFKADKPNQKWLTDLTEFSIPVGKVYLSPIFNCYDGMPIDGI